MTDQMLNLDDEATRYQTLSEGETRREARRNKPGGGP